MKKCLSLAQRFLYQARKNQWGQAQKEIKDYIDKGEASHHALETIRHVKSILTDDPDITKNMSTIMLAAQRNDPSIVRQK